MKQCDKCIYFGNDIIIPHNTVGICWNFDARKMQPNNTYRFVDRFEFHDCKFYESRDTIMNKNDNPLESGIDHTGDRAKTNPDEILSPLPTVPVPPPHEITPNINIFDVIKLYAVEKLKAGTIALINPQPQTPNTETVMNINGITNVLGFLYFLISTAQNLLQSTPFNWLNFAGGIIVAVIGYFVGKTPGTGK
jgi:hypothetical protein